MKEIVYIKPPFEDVQNDVTVWSASNEPLQVSLHTDLSTMVAIDTLRKRVDAQTLIFLKEFNQSTSSPLDDVSSAVSQCYGSVDDNDLLDSLPDYGRYNLQTESARQNYFKTLAAKDREAKEKYQKEIDDAKSKAKQDAEENALRDKFNQIFKS